MNEDFESDIILHYSTCNYLMIRSVYIVYTVLGDVSIYVVGKDEYDELACKYSLLNSSL